MADQYLLGGLEEPPHPQWLGIARNGVRKKYKSPKEFEELFQVGEASLLQIDYTELIYKVQILCSLMWKMNKNS